MSSFVTWYMLYLCERISIKYRKICDGRLLEESYDPIEFDYVSFKASIMVIVGELKEKGEFDFDDLLEALNTEFLKANVEFVRYEGGSDFPKYYNDGIVKGGSDRGIIYIFVNDKFFENLKDVNVTEDGKEIDSLVSNLYSLYAHEFTHLQQMDKEKAEVPGIDLSQLSGDKLAFKYLGNPREIDAHAREFAMWLLSRYDVKDIDTLFLEKEKNKELQQSLNYSMYYKIFGNNGSRSNKENRWKKSIFRKFLKRTYDFLLLDKRFLKEEKVLKELQSY